MFFRRNPELRTVCDTSSRESVMMVSSNSHEELASDKVPSLDN